MNGYVCFWRKERCEVEAETSYAAQQAAQVKFGRRCKKRHEITVVLAEQNGEQVIHAPLD